MSVVTKCVQCPTCSYIYVEGAAVITFSVEYLSHPGLAARNVDVEHYVISPDDLQPALGNQFAKLLGLVRIPLEERLYVGDLIENKAIFWKSAQQVERLQDVGQIFFEIFFARFKDRAFPMGVGNEPKAILRDSCAGG